MRIHKSILGILLIAMFLSTGCSSNQDVVDSPLSVTINNELLEGLYSGKLVSGKAEGEGLFRVSVENDEWNYNGNFSEGSAVGTGSFANKPMNAALAGHDYEGKYTGACIDGVIVGNGEFFSIDSGEAAIVYQGEFSDGQISGQGSVKNLPLTITYQDNEYKGTYHGDYSEGTANGMGTFFAETDDVFLSYDGNWKDSTFFGEGFLSTNNFTMAFSDVIRTGTFDGDLSDGIATGEGEYSVDLPDESKSYTYIGQWENGMWNGQGILTYGDTAEVFSGTFVDNAFTTPLPEL